MSQSKVVGQYLCDNRLLKSSIIEHSHVQIKSVEKLKVSQLEQNYGVASGVWVAWVEKWFAEHPLRRHKYRHAERCTPL